MDGCDYPTYVHAARAWTPNLDYQLGNLCNLTLYRA